MWTPWKISQSTSQGRYAVTLDGSVTTLDGAISQNVFQSPLFVETDLAKMQHELTLQNVPSTPTSTSVDVDYIVITAGDGNPKSVRSHVIQIPAYKLY